MEDLQLFKICVRLQRPLAFTLSAAGGRRRASSKADNRLKSFCRLRSAHLLFLGPARIPEQHKSWRRGRRWVHGASSSWHAQGAKARPTRFLAENPSFCSCGNSLEATLRRRLSLWNEAQKREGLVETVISRNGNNRVRPSLWWPHISGELPEERLLLASLGGYITFG